MTCLLGSRIWVREPVRNRDRVCDVGVLAELQPELSAWRRYSLDQQDVADRGRRYFEF